MAGIEVFGAVEEVPPRLDKEDETVRIQLAAPASWFALVDEWRRQRPELPNRSRAIRMMVEMFAAAEAKKRGAK